MKKHILIFIIISTATFAQSTIYSKLKKGELVDSILQRDFEIKELKENYSKLQKNHEELLKDKLALEDSLKQKDLNYKKLNESYSILYKNLSVIKKDSYTIKSIIKDDNNYWLKDLFDKKYTDSYFMETDIESEDITQKITKSNVYIYSIKSVEENTEVIEKCNRALEFNENYKTLFAIQNTILSEKYNEESVLSAINSIERLPILNSESKLDYRKAIILYSLKNYLDSTCSLKRKLDSYKNAECKSLTMQKIFTSLENDDDYKEYGYLITVIRKMKNDKIDYADDDLQPCEKFENYETESEKPLAPKIK